MSGHGGISISGGSVNIGALAQGDGACVNVSGDGAVTGRAAYELPSAGDEAALLRLAMAVGIGAVRLAELREALARDRDEAGAEQPRAVGTRLRGWLVRASADVGTQAAGGVLSAAIVGFLGG
ncbi:MAG: hypothetical protein HY241_07590 [Actinobacteria bacterium]|nr:hypothetical protein [Actinomycetota bacterium]